VARRRDGVIIFGRQARGTVERREVRQSVEQIVLIGGVDAIWIRLAEEIANRVVITFPRLPGKFGTSDC
jgi:hypothetical protein